MCSKTVIEVVSALRVVSNPVYGFTGAGLGNDLMVVESVAVNVWLVVFVAFEVDTGPTLKSL